MDMVPDRQAVIDKLKQDLLLLQGFKPSAATPDKNIGLNTVFDSFPKKCFPLGSIHEFIAVKKEDQSATLGFVSGLIASMASKGMVTLWITPSPQVFPPALVQYGLNPEQIIFINIHKQRDILWVMEEALKCDALFAVVSEISNLNFKESRRLQLAVEKSNVTGFIIRTSAYPAQVTATIARWNIKALSSYSMDGLPGFGYPVWNVSLLKVRNGKPGTWEIEWNNTHFRQIMKVRTVIRALQQTA